MREGRTVWLIAGVLGASSLTTAAPAWAISPGEARGRAELALRAVENDAPGLDSRSRRVRAAETLPERRIAEGDILLREKNYAAAIHVFEQVKELFARGQAAAPAHADALFLLGEAYMADDQLLAARRQYREILDRADQGAYSNFAGRSLSRLVDVSLRAGDLSGLDEVFSRMAKLPSGDGSGSIQYARGKAFFARGDFSQARQALSGVGRESAFSLQAHYLLGVVLVKEALAAAPANPGAAGAPSPGNRYAAAIEQFRKVTRLPVDSDEERHVVDLAWMAIGRLFYETDDYLDAADAYSHVDRKSREFSPMLYELAWVYVRLGDYQRAQRALEVLTITDPDSLKLADGSLLRADLMLRSGQFEKAYKAYEGVRKRYDPIRAQVDDFLANTTDPAVYYDQLVDDGVATTAQGLPPVVMEWARDEAEDARVFAAIDDVNRSRDLVRRSRSMAARLNAVLASPTRVKAFPEVREALEATLGAINKVTLARRDLAFGMDDVAGKKDVSGELASIRSERRELMKRLGWLPINAGDFARRESAAEQQWNTVSQRLQQLTLEADRLQALVNGLKRVLEDADEFGVTKDLASRQRFKSEIEANERDLNTYREQISMLQEGVDMGRVQVGFGDQRYVDDAAARQRFRELFRREVELTAEGGGKTGDYARSIQPVLARADRAEAQLTPIQDRLEALALERAAEMRALVTREAANLEAFAADLDRLDQEARLLVGEVAMQNLGLVRDRLKSIVLRADVGIVQEAWEVREEQRIRVQNLQRERAIEERKLDDELREVLDDSEDTP
jgi:tetratricopeptide (TPR) repeat protein